MIYVAAVVVIVLPLFLLWSGRGRMGSERFARRYPLSAELHRQAEALRKDYE